MITCAKAMTSGYSPIGATIISDKLFEPFSTVTRPSTTATRSAGTRCRRPVAMENLDIFEEEGLLQNVQQNAPLFKAELDTLRDLPIVGDVRGDGYFYGIELVKDKATKTTFDDAESERLLRGFLSKALFDAGVLPRRRPR